ncbi:MAG: hypothetical protein JWO86_751 [Myxococcaceae bacterium]|nr:hypothetical protein [Myxococcaceae bacterium]
MSALWGRRRYRPRDGSLRSRQPHPGGPRPYLSAAVVHLGRLVGELVVIGASGRSSRIIVERSEEREPSTTTRPASGGGVEVRWHARGPAHVRAAEVSPRQRGLRLRLRAPAHEQPRGGRVSIERLAAESKAYASASGARTIVHGYQQLHAYLTALETEATRGSQGLLVISSSSDSTRGRSTTPRSRLTLGAFGSTR